MTDHPGEKGPLALHSFIAGKCEWCGRRVAEVWAADCSDPPAPSGEVEG